MSGKLKYPLPEIGDTFENLKVLRIIRKRDKYDKPTWFAECVCKCGKIIEPQVNHLRNGQASCGCIPKSSYWKTRDTKLRRKWVSMLYRCYRDATQSHFGRIKVCDEWFDFDVFAEWAYTNGWGPQSGLELDRIDCNGNYSQQNCQFLTKAQHSEKSAFEKRKE